MIEMYEIQLKDLKNKDLIMYDDDGAVGSSLMAGSG